MCDNSVLLAGRLDGQELPFPERTIVEWREVVSFFGKEVGKPAKVSFTDRNVPTRDGHSLTCRIFNDQLSADSPVFLFYPGCAFLFDFFEVK
jgi:hypothetical protein